MLVQEKFERVYFKDVVDAIFSTDDRAIAEEIIETYSKFWMAIPGTRGATGKKTVNASTMFNTLFEEELIEGTQIDEHRIDDSELDETALDNLENELSA
jgi:hypothetical protein